MVSAPQGKLAGRAVSEKVREICEAQHLNIKRLEYVKQLVAWGRINDDYRVRIPEKADIASRWLHPPLAH